MCFASNFVIAFAEKIKRRKTSPISWAHTNTAKLSFWRLMFQSINHIVFQQLLVRHPHLHRHPCRTMLPVPTLHQGHVQGSPCPPRPNVEGPWGPQQAIPLAVCRSTVACPSGKVVRTPEGQILHCHLAMARQPEGV